VPRLLPDGHEQRFFASERGKRFVADLPIGRWVTRASWMAPCVPGLGRDELRHGTALYVDGGHALA